LCYDLLWDERNSIIIVFCNGKIELIEAPIHRRSLFYERLFPSRVEIGDRVVLEALFEVFDSHKELTRLKLIELRSLLEGWCPGDGILSAEGASPIAVTRLFDCGVPDLFEGVPYFNESDGARTIR